jgi:hypothetical protein
MITVNLFIQVLALVLLLLAALKIPNPEPARVNLGWMGLFFWLLSITIKI